MFIHVPITHEKHPGRRFSLPSHRFTLGFESKFDCLATLLNQPLRMSDLEDISSRDISIDKLYLKDFQKRSASSWKSLVSICHTSCLSHQLIHVHAVSG